MAGENCSLEQAQKLCCQAHNVPTATRAKPLQQAGGKESNCSHCQGIFNSVVQFLFDILFLIFFFSVIIGSKMKRSALFNSHFTF